MALQIENRRIERVLIVDDDEGVRSGYEETLSDCDVLPVSEPGPIKSLDEYIRKTIADSVQAAVCDHHLKKRAYSVVDGAELIAGFYQNKFPALLCTRWADAQPDVIRLYRRHIPVLLNFDEIGPDAIADGLHLCVREIDGYMAPSRKPWRTLVRVEEIESEKGTPTRIFVVIPGWNPNQVINLPFAILPHEVQVAVQKNVDRVFAEVNIGAENEIDLYFQNWKLA